MKKNAAKKRASKQVRKFFYVTGPRSKHRHILFGARVEGNVTACGRPVAIGWKWTEPSKQRQRVPVCTQCKAA